MDIGESSAPCAHPSAEDRDDDTVDDDTVEAHYSSLERLRPHACIDGWVFVGYVDEYGEEREASYACRDCAGSPRGR
jgi:hypothetical protein